MAPADPNRRIRVLWAIKGLGPGGAEGLLVTSARTSDHDAIQFGVCYVQPRKDQLVGRLQELGVEVHRLSGPAGWSPLWPWRFRSLLVSWRPDVVHFHSPLVAGVGRLVALTLLGRRPRVMSTEHNVWQRYSLPTRVLNALTCRLDAVQLAVSQRVASSMWPRFRGRVEVLVHGIALEDSVVDAGSRAVVRAELGVPDATVLVCTVANLRAQKAYPDLLAAAEIVCRRSDQVRFVAVGQGPLEDELRELHSSTTLGDRFTFLGYREDVMEILAASDIFALSSLHEGYPIAIMEAMAMGLPIVATDVGGVRHAVEDGADGRLVPPGDPHALAAAVLRLVQDEDARSRYGTRAKARSVMFDARAVQATIERHYRELAGPRGSAEGLSSGSSVA